MSSRRSHLTLILLLVAALAGVAALGWPGSPIHRSIKEGLDLQGGLEVVLQAKPLPGQKVTAQEMLNSTNIIRSRVDKLGVAEPVITQQGSNEIDIELPAVHNPEQAAKIVGQTAELEMYDLTPSLYGPSIDGSTQQAVPDTSLFDLLSIVQSGQKGTPSGYDLFNSRTKAFVTNDVTLKLLRSDPVTRALAPLGDKRVVTHVKATKGTKAKTVVKLVPPPKTTPGFPTGYEVLTVPPKTVVVTCDSQVATLCPSGTSGVVPAANVNYYYLFRHGSYPGNPETPYPQLTGKDLQLSGTQASVDDTGAPIVTLQFTGTGDRLFHEITRDEAQRGLALGAVQSFAIVLDDQLYSFPTVDYTQYADGINPANGGAEISGLPSMGAADNLALVLQTGALPLQFTTVERTDVSPTLGKASLHQARDAAIAGLILVVLFLLVLYRFLGVVAVVGLGVYAALMYGAILLLNVVLTLPGFAGLILTIGVAADANVVIFERIKEEVRNGRSVRAAISAGYAKGFRTIVDANVVTAITALILFGVATSEVKGFALMLLIGTVISLVTAVAATRAMLGLLAGFRWFSDPKFMGAKGTEIPRWQRIDVVGRRRLWFVISLVAIVISVGAMAIKGLNLGIDFTGGAQITFSTHAPTPLSLVRSKVASATGASGGGALVQGTGRLTGSQDYRNFQVRIKTLSTTQQSSLSADLSGAPLHAQKLGITNVSASFSRQILDSAILAIAVSFALIALYVTFRYRWRFAVPILRTLINDIPIVGGVYALSGRQVTSDTVAAVLTILGYSIYDTIIVFDRIRENMRLMPKASIGTIANVSVSEVLKRSIVTVTITLLPIVALFTYGGSTLRDFAFAIMVGIAVGAVSTIFIATPLLVSLMERDADYAGRRDVRLDSAGRRRLLARAERAAVDEPAPTLKGELEEVVEEVESAVGEVERVVERVVDGAESVEAKRQRRRQRRASRPHGRPR